jgi:ankyrin repeat protein
MKRIILLLFIFFGGAGCNDLTAARQKKIIQQFIEQKQKKVKNHQHGVINNLLTKITLTAQQERELKVLFNEFEHFIDQVYFGPSGLLYKTVRRLREQGNFDAFNSIEILDQAVEKFIANDSNCKALWDIKLKQLKEEAAFVEKNVSQIIRGKNAVLPYQPILKGLGALSVTGGLSFIFYKFLKDFQKLNFCFKLRRSSSGKAESSGNSKSKIMPPVLLFFKPAIIIDASHGTDVGNLNVIPTSSHTDDKRLEKTSEEPASKLLGLQLIVAMHNDNIEEAGDLIRKGADVNAGEDGARVLHWIIKSKNSWTIEKDFLDTVNLLLNAGADVHAVDNEGYTPLHWAAKIDSLDIVKMLLDAGADVDVQDNNGTTPLHKAAVKNSSRVVKMLLKAGADSNLVDNDGATPLHWATLKSSSSKTTKILLNAGAHVNVVAKDGCTPLCWAAQSEDMKLVFLLMIHGADVNAIAGYDLMSSETPVSEQLIKETRTLLASGQQLHLIRKVFPRIQKIIEKCVKQSVSRAVVLGDAEQLKSQLDGIPNELREASRRVQTILRKKLCNSRESSELAKTYKNTLEEDRKIISGYCNQGYLHVNRRDDYGWTALHWAMAQHDVVSMLALLEAGADVTSRTDFAHENKPYQNMTPLDIVFYNEKCAIHDNDHKGLDEWSLVIDSYERYFSSRDQFVLPSVSPKESFI